MKCETKVEVQRKVFIFLPTDVQLLSTVVVKDIMPLHDRIAFELLLFLCQKSVWHVRESISRFSYIVLLVLFTKCIGID